MVIQVSESVYSEASNLFGDLLTVDLSKIQEEALREAVNLEKEAVKVGRDLKKEVPVLASAMRDSFWNELQTNGKLSEKEKEQLQEMFSEGVIKHLEGIPNALYDNLKEGKGILFYGMMNETVIDALDSIIEFKKSVDELYPGLSDGIIKAASFAITAAVVAINPAAGVALKASGVMEIAQDFLKTDNLEKTRKNLKTSLDKFEQDKELKEMKKKADLTSDVAEKSGVSANVLNRIGLSEDFLKAAAADVTKVPAYKEFMQEMTKYMDQVIPSSKEQIAENLEAVKTTMLDTMKQNGVPETVITSFSKDIDNRFKEVEKLLAESLDPEKSFLEKVAIQQQGAQKLLENITQDLSKHIPNSKDAQKAVMGAVATEVVKRISGPVEDLQKSMKAPAVKKVIEKEMGRNQALNVLIEKTAAAVNKARGSSQGRQ